MGFLPKLPRVQPPRRDPDRQASAGASPQRKPPRRGDRPSRPRDDPGTLIRELERLDAARGCFEAQAARVRGVLDSCPGCAAAFGEFVREGGGSTADFVAWAATAPRHVPTIDR
ncbi:MAG TPA: hypothetical protein VJ890_05625 [Vineibacter sp.]|nr:hypothetical protein [Vineibacter sp.]